MLTRNLGKVQEALHALNPVQGNINELKYYKKELDVPNHSNSQCSSVRSTIDTLAQQHSEVVNALIMYGTTYQSMDENLAMSNNPDYQSLGTGNFSYISAPEHQKGFWEKTSNQIILGDFSEDVTWLGSTISIGAAFIGVDAPMDVRDFIANVSKRQWFWAGVSLVSLLPIIGVLGKGGKAASKGVKATTDIIDAGSTAVKHGSNIIDAGSTAVKHGSNVVDAGSSAIKQGSNVIDGGTTILTKTEGIIPKTMVDDYFDDLIKHSEFPQTIANDGRIWTKISTEQNGIMRAEFQNLKPKLISEWEVANNMKWPRYDIDIFTDSGKRWRKAGDLYDAHHIKPLEFGGLNTFDNITPLHANIHADKKVIHAPTSPFGDMDKLFK